MTNKIAPFSISRDRFSCDEEKTALMLEEINSNDDYVLTPDDLIEVADDKVVVVARTIPIFKDSLLKKFDPKKHKLNKKYTDDFWFVGRKSITAFCSEKFGVASWHTVKTWGELYALPVRYLPNGEPFLIYIEAINWAIMYDNIVKGIKREQRERCIRTMTRRYAKAC